MSWYLSYGGKQMGPFPLDEARARAMANPSALAWREGMGEWRPVSEIAEFRQSQGNTSAGGPPPLPPAARGRSDEIDFEIHGKEMQFVTVELDPGETVVSEAGAMMFKHPAIKMETILGDGSEEQTGFMAKLLGAGKRLITGESMFTTTFTHSGQGKATVAFAAPYPGNIIPVDLKAMGGTLICQKDAFLCAARGVSIGVFFQRKVLTGLFGGDGFIMQKLDGDGMVFVHAGGTVIERDLAPGEVLHVDTGCVVAMTKTVDFDVKTVSGIKSALFGGEGVFFAEMTGPGKVWLQSLPFSRLAGRMLAGAPSNGGGSSIVFGVGESSSEDNS